MAVDDVDKVEDGAAREPASLAMQSYISLHVRSHVKIGVWLTSEPEQHVVACELLRSQ
jgi:hypothetical protein